MKPPAVRNTGKLSESGRRAILIPLFICLLALLPPVRQACEWLDFKFTDRLFSSLPLLNQLTGRPEPVSPPVLIINKDQTFFQRFQRDPDRGDFAELTRLLTTGNARILAFDFIFDQPTTPGKDQAFAAALASFPFPLLATHYTGRGTQTFEKVELADSQANRPPWPHPLFADLEDQAAGKALINVAADLDSTVRFAPLAFHPTEMEEFLPTLGFAAWLATLLDQQSASISAEIAGQNLPAGELLNKAIAAGPFKFISCGHPGLDGAARRQELLFIARLLASAQPGNAQALKLAAQQKKLAGLPQNTWLKMPEKPLPVIGDYHMPCLRLPFNKLPPPFKGDGIQTLAMGTLLETEADRASTLLNHRNMLNLDTASGSFRARLALPAAKTGSCTIGGMVTSVTGQPVSEAEVLLLMPEQKFWQLSSTSKDGKYELPGIPTGNFTLQIINRSNAGWQKGIYKGAIASQTRLDIPMLMLADWSSPLRVAAKAAASESASLCMFGEPMPLLISDAAGRVAVDSLPEGFNPVGIDLEQTVRIVAGRLMDGEDEPVANQTIAIVPETGNWLLRFFQQQPLANADSEFMAPTSLDARLALFSSTAADTVQKTVDLILIPSATQVISELPRASRQPGSKISLSFDYPGLKPLKILMFSETGENFNCMSDQTIDLPPGRYLVLSELDGLRGMLQNHEISQRTVFVGSALPSDQDFIVTPVNFMDPGFTRMPGVNLHANLFSALIQQRFMNVPPFHSDAAPTGWPLLQFLLLLPALILLNAVFVKAGAIWGGIWVMGTLTGWLGIGTLLFVHQILLPFFFPGLLLTSFGVFRGYLAWAISRQQEKETRQTFGRFISSAVVEEILKTPDSLKPGGEKKELSVIFTDLAGFTTISEKLAPEQLTELMNEYLDEMTRILFRYGGTLDKYIGDAIMGFWNHPAPQPDHAQRAVECAISMQSKLAELREKWLKQGLPRVEVRAGINSAVCMVGFIGSDIQMNFTCLGDGVNLASRLEGANKAYGTLMMISDAVHRQIDQTLISTRFLDFLAVKGKDRPVEVFEVRGYRRNETTGWVEAEKLYAGGIEMYLQREWDAAIEAFSGVLKLLPDDGPSQVYIDRCKAFKTTPPPEQWDGRYVLKSK